MQASTIYKILPAGLWRDAEATGHFRGSPVDLQDGFIHFSTAAQVEETAARHFAGQHDLILVAVEVAKVDGRPDGRQRLQWEPSRQGALFPHLYGDLPIAAVRWVRPLPLGDNGWHRFPSLD